MKNPTFEQPFNSARTNSRSLLFRSRRRGRPCRRRSLSGLASHSMAMQSWRVVPRILSMCCTPWASQPLFCLAGHVRKGAHDQRNPQATAWAAWKPRKGPPDAKFQPIHLSASIARHSADGLRSGAYSLDAGSPRNDRRLA